MYGKYVKVKVFGQVITVFVFCTPQTPMKDLKKRAQEYIINKTKEV